MRTTRILIALALLPALATELSAAAEQDDWYDIEVIVFEHKTGPGVAAEAWSADPGAPATDLAIEVILPPGQSPELLTEEPPAVDAHLPYRQLEPDELQLERLHNRLTLSAEYEPLLHIGWRQTANVDQPVRGVHVHTPPPAEVAPPPSTLFIDTVATRSAHSPVRHTRTVDGIISLQRSRFLHLNLDLLLSEATTGAAGTGLFSIFSRQETRPANWRLQAQRRIRVNEVHYFDHPVFGVIVRVTPHTPSG